MRDDMFVVASTWSVFSVESDVMYTVQSHWSQPCAWKWQEKLYWGLIMDTSSLCPKEPLSEKYNQKYTCLFRKPPTFATRNKQYYFSIYSIWLTVAVLALGFPQNGAKVFIYSPTDLVFPHWGLLFPKKRAVSPCSHPLAPPQNCTSSGWELLKRSEEVHNLFSNRNVYCTLHTPKMVK